MSNPTIVCSACGHGYMDIDHCPTCVGTGDVDAPILPMYWDGERWIQRRMDGTSWAATDRGLVPVKAQQAEPRLHECRWHRHAYWGTSSDCPMCSQGGRARNASNESRRRWRRVAGIAVVAAVGFGGAVAYYVIENQRDPAAEAAPSTTTTTAAPTTTTPITPSVEFLAAVDYEQDLVEIGGRVQVLVDGVLDVNERWDQRDVSQEFAAEFLSELEQFAQQIEFRLSDVASRSAVAVRHDLVERSVAVLADDVALIRQGLLEPGSRKQRDDATLGLIVDADLTLEAIDLALEANSLSMERPPGRQVLRDTLRVGDCTTSHLDDAIVVLASCSETESGIVLATVSTTAQKDMSSFACQRAALAHVDTDTGKLEGTWTIEEVGVSASGSRVICLYDAGTDPKPAIASSGPITGPVTAMSGAPLVRLDLVEPTTIEAGDCFTDSPDSESRRIAEAYSTTCDAEDARYAVVSVRFVAVDTSATKANRSALQVWRVCEDAATELASTEPYVSEFFLVPVLLDSDDSEYRFFTVGCVGSIETLVAAGSQEA